eukprot:CAMPEP_0116057540 /NCGR_PEP_ID=MMETSP0322-20121206/4668_1 /TAXON_ID=163516 /ORGANISM="Leptocylindrus danicus var. apora, Strain B651" /LENGTH=289 /DNA_ID=CAMNT_0003541563 /DNA_START=180 /DNA_END=1049 /DNA_ORIENTATION=-
MIMIMMTMTRIVNGFAPNSSSSSTFIKKQKQKMKTFQLLAEPKKSDNKAMAFLRQKGRVGGSTAQDFINAMGVDEGPAGGKNAASMHRDMRKSRGAYKECSETGIVDDLSETFPFTSSGNEWSGVTDQVMGGTSNGSLTREEMDGKTANVLRGKVSLANNGGFVQMATDLALNPSSSPFVDASNFDGVEIVVYCDVEDSYSASNEESFNVHLRNQECSRQFSSYRATFAIEKKIWKTIRLPWSCFVGYGPGASEIEFDNSTLRRLGIVAIGREMEVMLAVASVSFYRVL